MLPHDNAEALTLLRAKHARTTSRFQQIDDCELHWIDEGSPNHLPTILLTSAQWLGADHFDELAQLLSRNTRVIRLDLPGHGLSGGFAGGDYSAPRYAQVIRAFATANRLERHVIIGQSHSGIPTALAACDPLRSLAGIVLATTSGLPRQRNSNGVAGAGERPSETPGSIDWYASRLTRLFKRPHHSEMFGALIAKAQEYGELPGRAEESAARLAQFDPELMIRTLPQVTVPVLTLWSDQSTYLPPAMATQVADLLPDCRRMHIVPDSGHLLLADAPQDCAAFILPFLESLA